jgi:hypothetical protein
MRRVNPHIVLYLWILCICLFLKPNSTYAVDCGSCVRKVLIRTYSNADPNFNTTVFLQHFGSFFQSSCVLLGENIQKSEYVLTATLAKNEEVGVISLGITLGFTGGRIGQRKGKWEYISGTRHYYFGDLIRIVSTWEKGDSLKDVIKSMKEEIIEPIEQTMRRFEQIPKSAEIDEDLDCEADSSHTQYIDMKSYESGYPRIGGVPGDVLRQSDHYNRVVVHAKEGKIINGTPLEDDESYKVFKLSSHRNSGQLIQVHYQAPESEDKSDTIIFYNSCDILYEEVLPLTRTSKNKEIAKVELNCKWEGTIESTFKIDTQGDESFLSSALLAGGKFQGKTDWTMDVVFKLNRGNERVKIYELESVRFKFLEEGEGEVKMRKEGREVIMGGTSESRVRGRELSRSECDLELIINLQKKTYKIEGFLLVENIPGKGDGKLKIDVGPIQRDKKESEDEKDEYSEQILIKGKFSEDFPKVLKGSTDELKETPQEFQDFIEGLAGEVTSKLRWKLERQDKN